MDGIEIKDGLAFEASRILAFWEANGIHISPTDNAEEVDRLRRADPGLLLCAAQGDRLLGTAWGTFDGRRGFINHVAVDLGHRRSGLGRRLVEELMAEFRRRHVYRVHLFVARSNAQVVAFYEQLGFSEREDLIMMSATFERR